MSKLANQNPPDGAPINVLAKTERGMGVPNRPHEQLVSAPALPRNEPHISSSSASSLPSPSALSSPSSPSSPDPEKSDTDFSLSLPLQSWDRYKILSVLGQGGMGTVYKAKDLRLDRFVAIKFMRRAQTTGMDAKQLRLFQREARTQAKLDHPHICKIFEVGELEGQPYIVMQLINGRPLDQWLPDLSRKDRVAIIHTIAEALHVAHERQLIHRDIKPGNIMVEQRPDGTFWPYLMDFGLAKEITASVHTTTGTVEGTPAFMAPEQVRGEIKKLDRRTDVYALGVTLFSVLTGKLPFSGNATTVLFAVMTEEPPKLRELNAGIPKELETIVDTCMEKDPARRYPTAQALALDLNRYLDGAHIAARPISVLRRLGRFAKRNRILSTGIVTALVAVLVLGSVALRMRAQAAQQEEVARWLGQEVKDLEWILRSARQLPIHNLEREKVIVRRRMENIQAQLATFGQGAQSLGHYGLGRGHLALQEYPQALSELQQAIQLGLDIPELHYALGIVLSKQFEQKLSEQVWFDPHGTLSEDERQKGVEQFLRPAIASLEKSRALKLAAPFYLEALIAYLRQDYEQALSQVALAGAAEPWRYDVLKLQGDIHHLRALAFEKAGKIALAEQAFAQSIHALQAAAAMGQSDTEVHLALASNWGHQTAILHLGKSLERLVEDSIQSCQHALLTDPVNRTGHLQLAWIAGWSLPNGNLSVFFPERLAACLDHTQFVLNQDKSHPEANMIRAICLIGEATQARQEGRDVESILRRAITSLDVVLSQRPQSGLASEILAGAQMLLGETLQPQGAEEAKALFLSAARAFERRSLRYSSPVVRQNVLWALAFLTGEVLTDQEATDTRTRADDFLNRCMSIDSKFSECHNNYFQVYTKLAQRELALHRDPRPLLDKAFHHLALTRQFGPKVLDAEQHAALAHFIQGQDLVERKQDPSSALTLLQEDLKSCLLLAKTDAMCLTLAARSHWLRADRAVQCNESALPWLHEALSHAELATQSPSKYPDAWQTLAETQVRLAQLLPPKERPSLLAKARRALDRALAINPKHAPSLTTIHTLKTLSPR